MKRYKNSPRFKYQNKDDKHREQEWNREHKAGGFRCHHCRQFVVINALMGTVNRNHCNLCLWSRHVDIDKGDRRAACNGGMRPIGLTFKHEGHGKQSDIMIVHRCSSCQKISINRIARDDIESLILDIFEASLHTEEMLRTTLLRQDITLLTKHDRQELYLRLFGHANKA